ncbi:unnamed protein product, partial [Aphanomyces euteiches]
DAMATRGDLAFAASTASASASCAKPTAARILPTPDVCVSDMVAAESVHRLLAAPTRLKSMAIASAITKKSRIQTSSRMKKLSFCRRYSRTSILNQQQMRSTVALRPQMASTS